MEFATKNYWSNASQHASGSNFFSWLMQKQWPFIVLFAICNSWAVRTAHVCGHWASGGCWEIYVNFLSACLQVNSWTNYLLFLQVTTIGRNAPITHALRLVFFSAEDMMSSWGLWFEMHRVYCLCCHETRSGIGLKKFLNPCVQLNATHQPLESSKLLIT